MALPMVAIVGRPNVGKSSLLNMITRSLTSIVDPTAGVTRDRVSAVFDAGDQYFDLVDTGGYGIEDRDNLTDQIEEQILHAVRQATLLLFIVDAQLGIVPLDQTVSRLLRKARTPVLLVANKCDTPQAEAHAAEFHRLGFGAPLCVSALHGRGRGDLLEAVLARLGPRPKSPPEEPAMKLAIVGKRNTGKSSLINALAGEKRVIVSEVPGTTRDAVDVTFKLEDRTFVAIDTAGVRKKSRFDDIEFYGFTRVTRALQRADVILFVIDSTVPVGQVDKHLARLISQHYKPCVLVVNKWDLAKGRANTDAYGDYLTETLPELSYAPISFTTATQGKNLQSTIDLAASLFRQARTRVPTAAVNSALAEILELRGPSAKRGAKRPRIYYATQVTTQPPTLVCFVNHPGAIKEDYQRFLINRFRERLPFAEVPIRLLFRSRRGSDRSEKRRDRSAEAQPDG